MFLKKLLVPVFAFALILGVALPVEAAVPGAPSGLALTAGADSITATWLAPTDDGGLPIDNYVVTLSGDADATQSPTGTSATFGSLVPGSYSVNVAAENADGVGAGTSASITIEPTVTAPSAPTGVTATVDGQSVTVNWTASADNGGEDPIYVIDLAGQTIETSATSATFNDVTPGTYTVTVDASNSAGSTSSAPSAQFTVETPVSAPGAPQSVTATVDGTTVNVSWTAPASDGGDSNITYSVALTGQATQTGLTSLSTSFTGLAPGSYTATVTASNSAGAGGSADSGEVTVAAPATVPGVPTGVSAQVTGADSALVSWSAPASDGGSAVTGYVVSVNGSPQSEGGTSVSLSGLAPGSYSVTVAAVNAVGTGAASGAVTFSIAVPVSAPGAPQSVTATVDGATVNVAWTAPASDGGDSNITYSVALTGQATQTGLTSLSTSFADLAPGSYTATVTASNSAGAGGSANSGDVTVAAPIVAPSPPVNPQASVSGQSITVSWGASTSNGGDPNVTYEVSIDGLTPLSGPGLSQTFTDVPAGDYTATVRASTPTGGQSTSVSTGQVTVDAPATVPGAPTELTATVSGLDVAISWKAPANNGGALIQDYVLTLNGQQSSPTETFASFTDLAPGNYTVTVAARNAVGAGPTATESFTIEVPIVRPGAPGNVSASVNGQNVTITWSAASDGNDPDGVEYQVSLNGGAPTTVTGTSAQFSGLGPGNYSVSVVATNSAGSGSPGTAAFAVFTAPSAPRGLAAAAEGSTIIFTWEAPASNGNRTITGYEVALERNGSRLDTRTVGADVNSIQFEGQNPGTYTLVVRASNSEDSNGDGPAASVDVEVGTTAPSAPTNVSATGVFQTVTITWDPPLSPGNSPLTGYEVRLGELTQSVDATTRSVVLADVPVGSQVAEVRAVNSGGQSLPGLSGAVLSETVFAPFDDSSGLIEQQYRDFLGRNADQAGLNYWTGILGADRNQGPIVIENFMRSEEFAPRRSIARLYLAFFDRAPDRDGFDFWAQTLRNGGELNDIAAAFAASDEFVNTYGELNDAEFIALVYNNVLLRQPDIDGFRFWLNRIQDPAISRGDLMVAFSESAEFKRNSSPAVDVIMTYRGMLDRAPDASGFAFWVGEVAGRPNSLQTLIFNFLVSEEYSNRVS